METLKAFVDQFLKGELVPYIKSEPVPEKNDGPLTVRALLCALGPLYALKYNLWYFRC